MERRHNKSHQGSRNHEIGRRDNQWLEKPIVTLQPGTTENPITRAVSPLNNFLVSKKVPTMCGSYHSFKNFSCSFLSLFLLLFPLGRCVLQLLQLSHSLGYSVLSFSVLAFQFWNILLTQPQAQRLRQATTPSNAFFISVTDLLLVCLFGSLLGFAPLCWHCHLFLHAAYFIQESSQHIHPNCFYIPGLIIPTSWPYLRRF